MDDAIINEYPIDSWKKSALMIGWIRDFINVAISMQNLELYNTTFIY